MIYCRTLISLYDSMAHTHLRDCVSNHAHLPHGAPLFHLPSAYNHLPHLLNTTQAWILARLNRPYDPIFPLRLRKHRFHGFRVGIFAAMDVGDWDVGVPARLVHGRAEHT